MSSELSRFILSICLLLATAACTPQVDRPSAPPRDNSVGSGAGQTLSTDGSLFGVRWRMVELTGDVPTSPPDRSPYIQFAPETNSINGFAGCNQFSGTYELLPGNRLRFSQMSSTMMACTDMSTETEMLRLLAIVDNYSLSDNRLSLNRARMAPLMIFEAVAAEN